MTRTLYFMMSITTSFMLVFSGDNNRSNQLPHHGIRRNAILPRHTRQSTAIANTRPPGSIPRHYSITPSDTRDVAHTLRGMSHTHASQRQQTQNTPQIRQSQAHTVQQLNNAIRSQNYDHAHAIVQEVSRDTLRTWGAQLWHTMLTRNWSIDNAYKFIKLLVTNGVPPDITDANGNTPLHIYMHRACQEDIADQVSIEYRDIVKFLIAYNDDLNIPNTSGTTPLHIASASEHDTSDLIRMCLQNGAHINYVDNNFNSSPIHQVKHAENARALLDYNADVTLENNQRETPLHTFLSYAQKTGMIVPRDLITAYITRGAPLLKHNQQHKTLIHCAPQAHVIYELSRAGAIVNSKDNNANAMLALTNDINIAHACIQCEADVDITNTAKETPLHKAVGKTRPDLCNLLLQNKARSDKRNKRRETAFDKTIQSNIELDKAILYTMLYHNRIGINDGDTYGNTYLHTLACHKRKKTHSIITLLSEGADVQRRNQHGKTPRDCSKHAEKTRIFRWVDNLLTMADDNTLPQPIHTHYGIDEYKIMLGQGYPHKAARWLKAIDNMTGTTYSSLIYDLMHSHVAHAHNAVRDVRNRYETPEYAMQCMEHFINHHSPLQETLCSDIIARYQNCVDERGNTLLHSAMGYRGGTESALAGIVPHIVRPVIHAHRTTSHIYPRNRDHKNPARIGKKRGNHASCTQLKAGRNAHQAVRYICQDDTSDDASSIYDRITQFITGFSLHNSHNR